MSKYQPVIDSYVRCIEDEEFFDRFYQCFFESDPIVKHMFTHVNLEKQKELVKKGLMSMITYLDSENIEARSHFEGLRKLTVRKKMNIMHHHFNSGNIASWKRSETLIQT